MRAYISRYNWILFDLLGMIAAFVLLASTKPGYASPIIYITVLTLFIATKRYNDLKRLGVATAIGVIWMLLAKDMYGYVTDSLAFFGYNVFPLFTVPIALIGLWVIYKAVQRLLFIEHFWSKLLLFTVFINWPIVILIEYAGYHWLGIQNASTAMYPGIAFCDCLHAPLWMQITYFAFGPIFFTACYLIGVHQHSPEARQKK